MVRMANPNPLPPAVLEAIRRGDKIVAIKMLREIQRLGLAEAKGIIDAIEAQSGRGKAPAAAAHAQSAASPAKHAHPHFQRRPHVDDLGPGEVPRSSYGSVAIVILLAAVALGVWISVKG